MVSVVRVDYVGNHDLEWESKSMDKATPEHLDNDCQSRGWGRFDSVLCVSTGVVITSFVAGTLLAIAPHFTSSPPTSVSLAAIYLTGTAVALSSCCYVLRTSGYC